MVKVQGLLSANGGPVGLTVHRERTRPLENDQLPAIVLYYLDEQPVLPSGQAYRSPLVERKLEIMAECRALGDNTTPPDMALDPIIVWASTQIFKDETFAGLALGVEEGRTLWQSKEGDQPVAAAMIAFTIRYRTSRLDPTSKESHP